VNGHAAVGCLSFMPGSLRRVETWQEFWHGRAANCPGERACRDDHARRSETMISQVLNSLRSHQLWTTLGWSDIKYRYRRTMIGPFWLTISMGAMIFGIGFIYAGLFGKPVSNYVPYLAIGMIVWSFISTTVNEGCNVFIAASGLIKSYEMNLPVYLLRLMWKNQIVALHNLILVAVLWLYFQWNPSWLFLLSIMGWLILSAFLFGFVLCLATICTRFRDVSQIISTILQLMFFITPIMWAANDLGHSRWIADVNPLFALIELIRAPLLGERPDAQDWIIAIGAMLGALAMGLFCFEKYKYRIVYWL
jgi:ABC-type polysaccharide/polyol phosphate export permease